MEVFYYLRYRAGVEGQDFSLSEQFFQTYLNLGARLFFGIEVDSEGNVLQDSRNPEALLAYRQRHVATAA